MIHSDLPRSDELDDLSLLRSSTLFDANWYLAENPDVMEAKVDAAIHFLYNGGMEGRAPSPEFSSKWYLDSYPDVKSAGMNPLIHFLRYGKNEGRTIQPLKNVDDLYLIRSSGLFDRDWYLNDNPDVASAGVDPLIHFVYTGGLEGRAPSEDFSSKWYLDTYEDVRNARINPLVHYLRFGQADGRMIQPQSVEISTYDYLCPVCQKPVDRFVPLPSFYLENIKKYGYPYLPQDAETLNVEQYGCPRCGASDRDRLYACYLNERLSQYPDEAVLLLDIAPSAPLGQFIERFPQVIRHTADLFAENVDFVLDITNMPEITSNTYDILICSHVLEHVQDDKQALLELYRVLKPGGWGIIMVPIILGIEKTDEDPSITDITERWRRFGQDDHVRLYSKTDFVERIKSAGFILWQLGGDYFGEDTLRRFGISKQSVLYVVEKPPSVSVLPYSGYVQRKCEIFFIIGTGRCGTTLMAQVINAHRRVCVPMELQIAFETSNNGTRLAEVFAAQKNLKYQAEDYIRLIDEQCPYNLNTYYDYRSFFNKLNYPIRSLQWLLSELYTDIAYSKNKDIFAEQTPWYGQNIELLNQLFPQAKFIHMIRDGRDVAISFARTPWWSKDVNINLKRWHQEVTKIEDDKLHWLGQRMLTLRYEDLVLEPGNTTKVVCEFLNLPFDENMLNMKFHIDYNQYAKHPALRILSSEYLKWERNKKSAFFSDSIFGWKSNNQIQFEEIDMPIRQTLMNFGYEG